MNKVLTTNPPVTRAQLKQHNLTKKKYITGFYSYAKQATCVNLGSTDFKNKEEERIIERFCYADTHETLHHAIHQITGLTANATEEKFIGLMLEE